MTNEKIFLKQRQADNFSVRVKASAGNFSATQLAAIKKISETFGAGKIHITSRQEISIPFIKAENFLEVEKILSADEIKLAKLGARIKNITACQGNEICLSGFIDSAKISRQLEKIFGEKKLPHKFMIAVCGCRNNCMKVEGNDIGIKGGTSPTHLPERCIYCGGCEKICPTSAIKIDKAKKFWTINRELCTNCGRCVKRCTAAIRGEPGFIVYVGGEKFLPLIQDEKKLFEIVGATINFFESNARPHEKLKSVIARTGWEDFKKFLQEKFVVGRIVRK